MLTCDYCEQVEFEMILQIALGIVLAVIILTFLPVIFSLSYYALIIGILVVVVGIAVWGLTYFTVEIAEEIQLNSLIDNAVTFIPAISIVAYSLFCTKKIHDYCEQRESGFFTWLILIIVFQFLPVILVVFALIFFLDPI